MPSGGKDKSDFEHANQQKKNMAVAVVSSLLLLAMIVAVTFGLKEENPANVESNEHSESISSSSKQIKAICQPTDYRETCEKSLSSVAGNTTDPQELIKLGFKLTIDQLKIVIKNSTTLRDLSQDPQANQALENCKELLEYAIDDLNESFSRIGAFDVSKLDEYLEDLKIWLSAALTYEQTCLDGFENTTGDAGEKMKSFLKTSQELTNNGLAMVTEVSSLLQIPAGTSGRRRILSEEYSSDIPSWISDAKRRLLHANASDVKADVVVAKDGSGKYSTVSEALKDVPKKSNKTFVIYVKAGIYNEHVVVDKSMTHVMIIGDGPTNTKITGSKNFVDGTQTFKTATVSVIGSNFIAKDMGFENSAGAAKHQAVALRVQSDMSIFYNCQMDGYQDTLYVHAHRQFYRGCTISGTIDFIFGNAAVVFQNSKMIVRKPLPNQHCMVTAQGRINSRDPTGIILQNCTIIADPEYHPVRNVNKAYLGRPWKEFSRTIIMQSHIDDIIQPDGWTPWRDDIALSTLFYAEFNNRGSGSMQTNRVTRRQ